MNDSSTLASINLQVIMHVYVVTNRVIFHVSMTHILRNGYGFGRLLLFSEQSSIKNFNDQRMQAIKYIL